jgi:hypothetical protein
MAQGTWHIIIWKWAKRWLPWAVRIWEEDDSVLSSDQLTRKADLFIAYSNSFGPGTYMWRELDTGLY